MKSCLRLSDSFESLAAEGTSVCQRQWLFATLLSAVSQRSLPLCQTSRKAYMPKVNLSCLFPLVISANLAVFQRNGKMPAFKHVLIYVIEGVDDLLQLPSMPQLGHHWALSVWTRQMHWKHWYTRNGLHYKVLKDDLGKKSFTIAVPVRAGRPVLLVPVPLSFFITSL